MATGLTSVVHGVLVVLLASDEGVQDGRVNVRLLGTPSIESIQILIMVDVEQECCFLIPKEIQIFTKASILSHLVKSH